MTIEFLGEKIFLEEVEASGQVWVARGTYKNIYALELDRTGLSLPVWSSRERVVAFLKNARLLGPPYEPEAVSLDLFTQAWLSDRLMGISELQINPSGKTSRVLCLTAEEFSSSQRK
jgi:hypothetical protein